MAIPPLPGSQLHLHKDTTLTPLPLTHRTPSPTPTSTSPRTPPTTPPQHSRAYQAHRKRYNQATCPELLTIFDARQMPSSVTKVSHAEGLKAAQQTKLGQPRAIMDHPFAITIDDDDDDVQEVSPSPFVKHSLWRGREYGSRRSANSKDEALDITQQHISPTMPATMNRRPPPIRTSMPAMSRTTVDLTGSPRLAAAGFASIYSEDFDSADWSLASRPKTTLNQPSLASTKSAVTTPTTPSAKSDITFDSYTEDLDPLLSPASLERITLNGKSLRPRSVVSARAAKLGHSPDKYTIISTPPRRKQAPKKGHTPSALTSRNIVRQQIAQVTKAKRDRFIFHNAKLFLPLLPERNYVRNLGNASNAFMSTVPYKEVAQPAGINATLKPYQLKGLSFLVHMNRNGMPSILGDEMGLGKTLQTLSLFQYITNQSIASGEVNSKESRPYLVICPLSVLENWVNEAKKFTPGLKVLRFHGPAAEREYLKDALRMRRTQSESTRNLLKYSTQKAITHSEHYDIVITTYEAFDAEAQWFKTVAAWRYVVLDEGHRIKNYNSKSSKSLQSLQAEYRLILTGTPLQNNLVEMWSLLHWLLPDVFAENTLPLFKSAFNLSKGHVNRAVLEHSKSLLELLMIRRMKSSPGVDLNLPTKTIVRLFVPLTPFQKEWYLKLLTKESDDMLKDIYKDAQSKEQGVASRADSMQATDLSIASTHDELKELTKPKTDAWRRLLNLVLQLRKVCTHAYLVPGAAPEINEIGPHVYENSGKFAALHKLVTELVLNQGKKMIIFSNFTQVLDWTHDLLTLVSGDGAKFGTLRLDGNVVRAKRNLFVRLFQRDDQPYKVFLISTKAGGIGLNLTAATEVVFMDEDWNPQVDLQAEARCHRIGQTKPVTIYKLCTAGSVEEQMLGRIHKKLYLSAKITESMQNVHDAPTSSDADNLTIADGQKLFGNYSEFKSLLRRGTRTLASDDTSASDLLKWDFGTMIEKCQRTLNAEGETETGNEVNEADEEEKWLATMEKVECAVFDGTRYQRAKISWQDSEPLPNSSKSDRRKGKETNVMIDGFAINKESLNCKEWESVPTLAGTDPSLKNVTRKKEHFRHQNHCQTCFGFEDKMIECNNCPRIYHEDCLKEHELATAKGFGNWSCSQHYCSGCHKRAAEAGGMIFRCRWCPNGYCEDCLDWDTIRLDGDNLPEYKVLKFPARREAYYITCGECNAPGTWEALDAQAETWAKDAEEAEAEEARQEEEAIRERIVVMVKSPAESEMDRKSVVDRRNVVDVEDLTEDLHSLSAASPTPELTFTTRSTSKPTSPRTPPEPTNAINPGAMDSPTPSKRKNPALAPGSHKKQKRERYVVEV